MQERITRTTKNGKEFQLKLVDGEYFYKWVGDGVLPPKLRGGFTGYREALLAWDSYKALIDDPKPSKEEKSQRELEKLSKKEELTRFAQEQEIEIPQDYKIPSQIKKYLKKLIGGE